MVEKRGACTICNVCHRCQQQRDVGISHSASSVCDVILGHRDMGATNYKAGSLEIFVSANLAFVLNHSPFYKKPYAIVQQDIRARVPLAMTLLAVVKAAILWSREFEQGTCRTSLADWILLQLSPANL
jgi:hypothetical protein